MHRPKASIWSRPAAPAALGIAACAACCAIPLTGWLAGAAAASTLALFLEPLAGALVAAAALLVALIVVRRRRSRAAACDIGCTLNQRDKPARHAALRGLFSTAQRRELRPGRASWTFAWSAATEARVRELTALEQRCCGFLRFDVERRGGELRWTASAPPEAHDALDTFVRASQPA